MFVTRVDLVRKMTCFRAHYVGDRLPLINFSQTTATRGVSFTLPSALLDFAALRILRPIP